MTNLPVTTPTTSLDFMNLMSQGGLWQDVLNDVLDEPTKSSPERLVENARVSPEVTLIALPASPVDSQYHLNSSRTTHIFRTYLTTSRRGNQLERLRLRRIVREVSSKSHWNEKSSSEGSKGTASTTNEDNLINYIIEHTTRNTEKD